MLILDPKLAYNPERVVSIVSSSRSGSTVFKYALCLHPELCSLAGEEEPYYKLARNGFPWHLSDHFHTANNQEYIRLCIANELHNFTAAENRRTLQQNHIEEPPFVEAKECRRTPTLVLKTPQNCYRRGVIEQLYPEAEIIYIVIKRDARAIVNGLLDGWESDEFLARETPQGWWCFDMPPGWSWNRSTLDTCIHQWKTSWKFLDTYYTDRMSEVWFEAFEQDWKSCIKRIWHDLDLSEFDPPDESLPHLSCTVPPQPERWKIVRPWLDEAVRRQGW